MSNVGRCGRDGDDKASEDDTSGQQAYGLPPTAYGQTAQQLRVI